MASWEPPQGGSVGDNFDAPAILLLDVACRANTKTKPFWSYFDIGMWHELISANLGLGVAGGKHLFSAFWGCAMEYADDDHFDGDFTLGTPKSLPEDINAFSNSGDEFQLDNANRNDGFSATVENTVAATWGTTFSRQTPPKPR